LIVETRDGRIVAGRMGNPTPGCVTIAGASDEQTTIDREAIVAIGIATMLWPATVADQALIAITIDQAR